MNKKWRILLIEPPFFRLYNKSYSLDRYPLALAYLAGAISKKTNWDVLAYNADFSLNKERENLMHSYLAGEGFEYYLRNLKSSSYFVWSEIQSTIKEYKPDVVGISSKSQNFAAVMRIANVSFQSEAALIIVFLWIS